MAGYREEPGVRPDSDTETCAAVKFLIDNWRWAEVPFYVRAGKRMPKRVTEIAVQFKQPPLMLFENTPSGRIQPNLLTLRIQRNEGISFSAERGHFVQVWREAAGINHGGAPGTDGFQLCSLFRR